MAYKKSRGYTGDGSAELDAYVRSKASSETPELSPEEIKKRDLKKKLIQKIKKRIVAASKKWINEHKTFTFSYDDVLELRKKLGRVVSYPNDEANDVNVRKYLTATYQRDVIDEILTSKPVANSITGDERKEIYQWWYESDSYQLKYPSTKLRSWIKVKVLDDTKGAWTYELSLKTPKAPKV